MPWDCKQCNLAVELDDTPCPGCGRTKDSWTMVAGATRTFTISKKRLELLCGERADALPCSDPAHADEPLRPASVARVTPRDVARRIAARGHMPPSRDVLTVRLVPKRHKDLTVTLAVNYETEEVAELPFPHDGSPVDSLQPVDVRFLFVSGGPPAPDDEVEFPGLRVVDLSEETPDGFAPSIEVSALKKPPRRLPTEPASDCCLRLQLALEGAGGDPLAGADYVLSFEGGEVRGTTDEQGALSELLPHGVLEATLAVAGEAYELLLDQLDPVEEDHPDGGVAGGQARLHNLGYELGPVDSDLGDKTRAAIERFQRTCGLEPSGALDAATRAELMRLHGC
jgi:Putative peptidoglycan binding domain